MTPSELLSVTAINQRGVATVADDTYSVPCVKLQRKFYPELESARGVAAMSVVVLHAILAFYYSSRGPAPILLGELGPLLYAIGVAGQTLFNGQSAVQFFFVLSGFVLGLNISNRLTVSGYVSFILRRFFRLMPAIWAAIALGILLISSRRDVPSLGTLVNYFLLRDLRVDPVLWSMIVEIAASLVFLPMLAIFGRMPATVQIVVLLPIYLIQTHFTIPIYWGSGYAFPLIQFYLGICVPRAGKMLVENAGVRGGTVLAAIAFALLCLPAASWILLELHDHFSPGFNGLNNLYFSLTGLTVPCSAFYIIAWIAYGRCENLKRLLNHRAVHHLGRISYSVYLLHLPLIAALGAAITRYQIANPILRGFIGFIIAIPATLLLAHLSWRFVEEPSRHLGRIIAMKFVRNTSIDQQRVASLPTASVLPPLKGQRRHDADVGLRRYEG